MLFPGAPPRIHNDVTAFLSRQLPERQIGRGGSAPWLRQSPSLTPLNFFLWDFVKDKVYIPPVPVTLNSVKKRIQTAIEKTNQPLMQNFRHEVGYYLDVCRATNGTHIELAYSVEKSCLVPYYNDMLLMCV
jgi:hypothetical protein